ncbi:MULTISPECIES: hypothetical protein [Hymenobacter]|uniref:Uncharacterized protein n=1 Tax=Hymenobacter profundi TaxID=1982110 RepID=A0ABS6X595_9BACT|nr:MULTISPECIES: hypothetical protein [Hymenobacter]MBW3130496.1 hypothetical protein [Hymenobacter profundi]
MALALLAQGPFWLWLIMYTYGRYAAIVQPTLLLIHAHVVYLVAAG